MKAIANEKITPGTILCGNVGYSMVIPVFYEVVSVTASGKSARIRELRTRETGDASNCFQGLCEPITGSYKGEMRTRRIKVANWSWVSEPYEYVSDGNHSYKVWDGKPKYYDYLD